MATPPTLTGQPIVCRYNKFGFCRYKEECKKHHVDESCVSLNCDISSCVNRHPKKCKFYKYRRCKFGELCRFDHGMEQEQVTVAKNDEKIDKIKKELDEKDEQINTQSSMISELEVKYSKMHEQMCEKDIIIDGLMKRMQMMENELKKIMDDKETELKKLLLRTNQLENKMNDLEEAFVGKDDENIQAKESESQMEQTFVNPYLTFKCELCEFKSKCKENLNDHMKENH